MTDALSRSESWLVAVRTPKLDRAISLITSSALATLIIVGFLVASPDHRHWFVVPVLLSGALIGSDAVDWFRGKLEMFDPFGVIGILGFHLFFLAPLLHVAWNTWMYTTSPPPDWRDWLGRMAILNFLGLVIYRVIRLLPLRAAARKARSVWQFNQSRFVILMPLVLVVTALAQALVYASFGGISGYIDAYQNRPQEFEGSGWIFMISESFPILAFFAFAVFIRWRHIRWSNTKTVIALVFFTGAQLLFGGLRGSRSNTIWALFWAVGIIHLWIQPVSRKLIYGGVVFLIAFAYVYGFYKEKLTPNMTIEQTMRLGEKRGRTLHAELLGDFGRADIQAFLLYRITGPGSDYEYAWGRTYAGALALLIPRSIWPDRPATSVEAGTNAQHYMGSYAPKKLETSKVFGLAGETMLNFGPWLVAPSFAIWGLVVGWVSAFLKRLAPLDSRILIAPFLVNFCIPVLIGDSDNIIFFLMKQGLIPIAVIALCSVRRRPREVSR